VSTLLPSPLPSLFHPSCQLYSLPLFLLSSIPCVNFTPFLLSSIPGVNSTPCPSSFYLPFLMSTLLPSPLPSLFRLLVEPNQQ
jgi:hypothetical protein